MTQHTNIAPVIGAVTATIAASATTSDEIDTNGATPLAVYIPSSFTTADLTFIARSILNESYSSAIRSTAGVYTFTTVAAGDVLSLDASVFAGHQFFKIVSSVTQASEREIVVQFAPVLTNLQSI